MSDLAHAFTHALARSPSDSATAGLRAVDVGAPDVARLRRDHAAYVAALEAAGVAVTVLPPLEAHPDATFIEDVALCLPRVAVLLVPGAPSRRGEVASVRAPLAAFYRDVLALGDGSPDDAAGGRPGTACADDTDADADVRKCADAENEGDGHGGGDDAATIEGGDVLVTPEEILVGLSARTNAAGARALARVLEPFGHRVRVVRTPPGVLHFKSDCSLLDGRTVLATERLAASGCFDGYRVVTAVAGEEAAANAVRVNDKVLFAAGHPRTAARLREAGYRVHELDNGEGAKLDGGMSCLSLRFAVAEDARASGSRPARRRVRGALDDEHGGRRRPIGPRAFRTRSRIGPGEPRRAALNGTAQVMTSGSSRPVRARISAISSVAAMIDASAS